MGTLFFLMIYIFFLYLITYFFNILIDTILYFSKKKKNIYISKDKKQMLNKHFCVSYLLYNKFYKLKYFLN